MQSIFKWAANVWQILMRGENGKKPLLWISIMATIAAVVTLYPSSNITMKQKYMFQYDASTCLKRNFDSCDNLIKEGIDPEMYSDFEDYRLASDAMVGDGIKKNILYRSRLAKYTLNYAAKNNITLDKYVSTKLIKSAQKLNPPETLD